jgi:hypothetical protein
MRFWRRNEVPADEAATRADVERAYEQGRQDEARRHRSHPVLGALVFVAALVGVGMIYLAAHEGSFTQGGQVVDQKLASAADTARSASKDAATATTNAGQTVQDAGQQLRQNSTAR